MNRINKINQQPLLWGLLHGLNDLLAGFLLATYTISQNYQSGFIFISLYAILAFGGQVPVGFWLDKKQDIRLFAKISLVLLPIAMMLFFVSVEAAIVFSGFASAFVHVTGGTICLQVHNNKSGPLGLFTAPGVLGLTVGGVLGSADSLLPLILTGCIIILGYFIFIVPFPKYKSAAKKQSELDSHDFIMLTILLFMCFRSFLFDVVNYVAENYENGILYLGVSAFLGKIIGGFLADKMGVRRFIYITLALALLLFQFGKENIYMLCAGIACLQSSVPVTLLMMGQSLPLHPASATAFSLGLSVVLAGLPLFLISDKRKIFEAFDKPEVTITLFIVLFLIGLVTVRVFYSRGILKRKI